MTRAARALLAAVLTICFFAWVGGPRANAATGELTVFGDYGLGAGQLLATGPIAIDPGDSDSIYVADYDGSVFPRLTKFDSDGTPLASVALDTANPGGGAMFAEAIALDATNDRIYVLMAANDHGQATAREILAYSTDLDCSGGPCAFVPASGLSSAVLVDFRLPAGGSVDWSTGLAVDPGTHKVAVLGIDDTTAADPQGVVQYVTDTGALSTRVTGFGAAADPNGTTISWPSGLTIAPDGTAYFAVPAVPDPGTGTVADATIYSMPRETGTATLFTKDVHEPQVPGVVVYAGGLYTFGPGSPIAVSTDGQTLWVAEGNGYSGRVRGYDTTTKAPRLVYGDITGTASATCWFANRSLALGLGAGAGNSLVVSSMNIVGGESYGAIHVLGDGGSDCPTIQTRFKVDGKDSGTITVNKGAAIDLDATASELLGGSASETQWDLDGSGQFATHVTGSTPLTTSQKFLKAGDIQVGLKVRIDGSTPTDPVYVSVKVVAPTPTAAFRASTKTPAAGASVTFDATDSLDPAGSPTGGASHDLGKYRWDFGDGKSEETASKTISHVFANSSTSAVSRVVKLTVVSNDDVTSNAVQQTITVAGTPVVSPPPPPPVDTKPPVDVTPPTVTLGAAAVDSKGTVIVKVSCAAGGVACTGKLDVTVKVKKKSKTTTVKLGTATFSIAAGKSKDIKFKLSSAGKTLLKKQKKLSASAAVSVTAGGKTSTKSKTLTLKAPAKRK